jgi:hypothetical protein
MTTPPKIWRFERDKLGRLELELEQQTKHIKHHRLSLSFTLTNYPILLREQQVLVPHYVNFLIMAGPIKSAFFKCVDYEIFLYSRKRRN